jgi:hypothetical protein
MSEADGIDRGKIATDAGLPEDLVEAVRGETAGEIEANAKKVAVLIGLDANPQSLRDRVMAEYEREFGGVNAAERLLLDSPKSPAATAHLAELVAQGAEERADDR